MSLFFLVVGSIAILIAIFANRLGLDSSPGWGRDRLALMAVGLTAYAISALSYLAKKFLVLRKPEQKAIARIYSTLDRIRQIIFTPLTGQVFGIFVCLGIALYALWYTSASRFPAFPKFSNDYIQLGVSFLHGQLSLLEQPGPELKALENPYDYLQRENIPYHWDASYYEGKYYLYWGPVPALFFAVAQALTHTAPPASVMVLLAYIGLDAVILILFYLISKHYFPNSSSLSPGLFTLMALVNLPFLFLLGNPQIYHTSIIYGQLFLLLGLLGWVLYNSSEKTFWLMFAGLNWGSALGSRINLAVSVSVFLVFALIWINLKSGWRPSWKREGSLFIPFALCVIALCVYNFARFGNPLETGQKYQLTIPVAHSSYFSIAYLPTNLFVYLFYPLEFAGKFPFVKSALFDTSLLPKWLSVPPDMSFDHNIFGIFHSMPGLWLMGLAIPLLILARKSVGTPEYFKPLLSDRLYLFCMVTLAGLGQFLFLMVFFFGAERYIPDFYLLMLLGTTMLVWRMDEFLKPRVKLRFAFWLFITGSVIWTVGIGVFGGFGVPPGLFRSFNAALYSQLASYWNDRSASFFIVLERLTGIIH